MGAQAPRVVQLADFASPYPGSFVPALVALADRCRAHGLQFQAVLRAGAERQEWYRELLAAAIAASVAPAMPRQTRARWLRALVREQQAPVLLHTHFAYWDVAAVLASLAAPVPVGVVWHRHGTVSGRLMRVRRALRFALLAGGIDAHLCVSRAVQAEALALRSPRERTLLVPNGIDLQRFAPLSDAERLRARAQLGIEHGDEALLAFVWEWERKGGELLLQALARLRQRRPHATLLLVGAPAGVRAQAHKLGLERSVRLLEPRSDVRSLYAAAGLLVSASEHEGMPFALLEALACGLPVVASDIGPHRDLAERLVACRLSGRDPAAFAAAVTAELEAPVEEHRLRLESTRAVLEREFGLDAWAARVLDVYLQVLAKVASAA